MNQFVGKTLGVFGRFRYLTGLTLVFIIAILMSPCKRKSGDIIFLTFDNLSDIMRQVSENGIIALGMTLVIISGGIDLSVGSLLALSATLVAKLLTQWNPVGMSPAFHIVCCVVITLAVCSLCGTLMGGVIARFKIQPFIVTLAGMIGLRGFARYITGNTNIDIGFSDNTSAIFANAISHKFIIIGVFVLMAIVFYIVLTKTVFGLRVKSIGDNANASKYAGLPVSRILIAVYMISGFMCGLAGILHAAQNHQGSPNDGVSYELDAIAAVVIGGASMNGGKGSIIGTVIGALILGILTNMFRLRGIDINIEMMFKALIIVVAVKLQTTKAN